MAQSVLLGALIAAGGLLLLRFAAAAFFCPVPPRGRMIYALRPEQAGDLEQTVRGLMFLRDCGLLRARLVIVLGDVPEQMRRTAQLLAREHGQITVIEQAQWPQWLESEA